MLNKEKYLTPHHIFGGKTFEEYCSIIPEFYFKQEVPEDVIKNFEIVEKLLAYSYYEYKFIDEAYAKALHSFEMAMKIRYNDFCKATKKVTFNTLIIELSKLNLFDTNLETLKRVKDLRNHYSHPESHSFGGIAIWNNIDSICGLINEMYEDINLRLERRKLIEEFLTFQKKFNLEKSVVIEIQGISTILYSLQLLFINNKYDKPAYLFACTPLFNLETTEEGSIKVPVVFKAKLIAPVLFGGTIEGTSFSAKKNIKFSSLNNHANLIPEFANWENAYNNVPDKFSFETSMNLYIPEILTTEFREFQKM